MKINNSNESAVMSGKWVKPGSDFYNRLLNEDNYHALINEAFLISGEVSKDTTYSQSGCKYPHHTIKNGELVVSAPGVKAAYSRAKQMGIYKGDVKAHLDKHMRELGFLNKDGVHYEEVMEENFRYIESVIDSTLGTDLVMMEKEIAQIDLEVKCKEDLKHPEYGYVYDQYTLLASGTPVSEAKYLKKEKFMYDIETYPSFRRKGYAEYLIRHLVSKGARHLNVGLDNTAAITLYKKIGFHDDGYVRGDNNEKLQRMTIDDDKAKKISDKVINESAEPSESIEELEEWIESFVSNEDFRESVSIDDSNNTDILRFMEYSDFITESWVTHVRHDYTPEEIAYNESGWRDIDLIIEESNPKYKDLISTAKKAVMNVGKRVFNPKRFYGYFGRKMTLNDLIALDNPEVLAREKPICVAGTNIPVLTWRDLVKMVHGKTDEQIQKESMAQLVTESILPIYESNFSNSEISKVCKEFSQQTGTPVLKMIGNNTNDIRQIMFVTTMPKDIIEACIKKDFTFKYNYNVIGTNRNNPRVILVNYNLIKKIHARNTNDLITMLQHEEGHVKTYNRISVDDWSMYEIQGNILDGIVTNLARSLNYSSADMIGDLAYYHHQLKLERMANEVYGLNPVKLAEILIGKDPRREVGKIFDVDKFLSIPVPKSVLAAGGHSIITPKISKEFYDYTRQVYTQCIRDPEYRKAFLSSLDKVEKNESISESCNCKYAYLPNIMKLIYSSTFGEAGQWSGLIYEYPATDSDIRERLKHDLPLLLTLPFLEGTNQFIIDESIDNDPNSEYIMEMLNNIFLNGEFPKELNRSDMQKYSHQLKQGFFSEGSVFGQYNDSKKYLTESINLDPYNRNGRYVISNTTKEDVMNELSSLIDIPMGLSHHDEKSWVESAVCNNYHEIDNVYTETETNNHSAIYPSAKTPEQLLQKLKVFTYGWISPVSKKVYLTDDQDPDESIFMKEYRFPNTAKLLSTKTAICWDMTELARKWFKGHNFKFIACYLEFKDKGSTTHTFIIYQEDDKYCWFEPSYQSYIAIHKYDSYKETIDAVIKSMNINSGYELHRLTSSPKTGITADEYMSWAKSMPEISDFDNIKFESVTKTIPDVLYLAESYEIPSLAGMECLLTTNKEKAIVFALDRFGIMNDYIKESTDGISDIEHTRGLVIGCEELTEGAQSSRNVTFTHNIRKLRSNIMSGNSIGYIHHIRTSDVINKLHVNNNHIIGPEFIYSSLDDIKPIAVEKIPIHWNVKYSNSNCHKNSEAYLYTENMTLIFRESDLSMTKSDLDITRKWFIRSDDGVDNCCISVKGYDKPMRGRSAMITLRLDDDKWEVLCKKNADDYGVPGGGWNKDESPKHAAIRELQEETLSNVKNVKRMGTLIEYHDTVKDWVKEHVPNKKDWWYGYYSAVFVGIYDGKFTGKVKEEDRESGYTWKKVDYKLMKSLPKEYADAINDYINKGNPFKESVFTEADESEEEKDILDEPIEDDTNQQDPPPVKDNNERNDANDNNMPNHSADSGPANDSNTTGGNTTRPQDMGKEGNEADSGDGQGDSSTISREGLAGKVGGEPTPPTIKTPISRPKQFANQEQDKNGVRRKNLYIEFIRWAKEYNPKNIFGSNFDKDIFNGSYPFVPDEMRYFYRLADPTLCILAGGLTFFPVIQLRKLNAENKHLDQYMIFAATNNDMRVFSNVDKRVYMATEQNGEIVLGKALANTFDMYIQTMIDKGDILNGPREDTTLEYVEDLE